MNVILRILLSIFEGIVLGSYIDMSFEIKDEKHRKKFLTITITSLAIGAYLIGFIPYKAIILNIGIVLLTKKFYDTEWIKLIVRVILYYMLVLMVELLTLIVIGQLAGLRIEDFQTLRPVDQTLLGYICTSIVLVVTKTIGRDNPEKKKVSWGYWVIILLSNISVMIIVFGIMSFEGEELIGNNIHSVTMTAIVGFIILNLFHFFIYKGLEKECQKDNEYSLIKHVNEGQFKYMMQNEKSFGIVRKVRHDLNNQMIGLDYLLETQKIEEARNYIQRISQTLDQVEVKYITGYPVVDTIINQKEALCKLYGINLKCKIGKIAPMPGIWSTQDICVVLGNALDNAIEAAREVAEGSRQIRLEMYTKKSYLVCKITNTCLMNEKQKKLRTSKDKRWHGIGLRSIRETVANYEGDVYIETVDGQFELKIIVPINLSE
ncbi:MAG: sensor histidine kinase [Cellulosilyticaceae bacterium]